jgi:hypothetical protein
MTKTASDASTLPSGLTGSGRCLLYAPAIALFIYLFLLTLVPLSDPDLWWHLKTGERIVEQGELQGNRDAFSYTIPEQIPVHVVQGMRSQWLGQVVLHLVHAASGLRGLALARGFLLVFPFVWLYVLLLREGHRSVVALGLLSFPALYAATILPESFERPQAFSFVLAPALVVLLERLRGDGRAPWMYVAIPLMMAVWANLHGGFIAGDGIIIIYMAGEAVRGALHRGSGSPGERKLFPRKTFLLVCGVSVLASFLNPNTYHIFLGWVRGMLAGFLQPPSQRPGYVMQQVLEYRSPWFVYRYLDRPWHLVVMGFLGLGALAGIAGYVRGRRPSLGGLGTTLMLGFFSLMYVRAVPFAVYVYPLYAGMAASSFRRRMVRAVPAALSVILAVLFFVSLFSGGFGDRLAPSVPDSWVGGNYPEGALQFMRKAGIEGPLFNPVHWGGYVIFRAYPEYRVFVDGRSLSTKVLRDTHTILNAGPGWEKRIDSYGVNAILIPVIAVRTGDVVPLVKALVWNSDWALLFLQNDQAVFVRHREESSEAIRTYALEKSAVWEEMLRVSGYLLKRSPGNTALLLARLEAYHNLGRYAEAGQAAEAVRESARMKGGSRLRKTLQILRAIGY